MIINANNINPTYGNWFCIEGTVDTAEIVPAIANKRIVVKYVSLHYKQTAGTSGEAVGVNGTMNGIESYMFYVMFAPNVAASGNYNIPCEIMCDENTNLRMHVNGSPQLAIAVVMGYYQDVW